MIDKLSKTFSSGAFLRGHGELLESRRLLDAVPAMVADINQHTDPALPLSFTLANVGGVLYFTANDGVVGDSLWKSDGTEQGTIRIVNDWPSLGSSQRPELTAISGSLYFDGNDLSGKELWKSDGTQLGTVRVKDIATGSFSSSPRNLTAMDGTLYFTAHVLTSGDELWKSDGTELGTVRVKDIVPGDSGSIPRHLTALGGSLYFTTLDEFGRRNELWKSDGTEQGTVRVKFNVAEPSFLTAMDGNLYFIVFDEVNGGRELWKSDGTEAGTVRVKDIDISAASLTAAGKSLYFSNDNELWKSDGTEAGTIRVKEVRTNCGFPVFKASWTAIGGTLYFTACEEDGGLELWKSDGTEQGTVLVKDIWPGSYGSDPQDLTVVDGALYFTANDGFHGRELWVLRPDDSNPGDVNSDGILTAADLDLISAAVGTQDLQYDLNQDLAVTNEDRRIWIEDLFGTFMGDTNLDRKVDFQDFLLLSANFGTDTDWEGGDFDGDGSVSFADFLLLSSNFGKSK